MAAVLEQVWGIKDENCGGGGSRQGIHTFLDRLAKTTCFHFWGGMQAEPVSFSCNSGVW